MSDDLVELLCPADEVVVEEMIDLVSTRFKDDHWLPRLLEFESTLLD